MFWHFFFNSSPVIHKYILIFKGEVQPEDEDCVQLI